MAHVKKAAMVVDYKIFNDAFSASCKDIEELGVAPPPNDARYLKAYLAKQSEDDLLEGLTAGYMVWREATDLEDRRNFMWMCQRFMDEQKSRVGIGQTKN
ncbi:MAG: hypothetical protein ACHP9V_05915 [Terriglobales bacterium]